jgi:hypothetical protein
MAYILTYINNIHKSLNCDKRKAIPVQTWTSPEGYRSLGLSGFLDSRHMKVARWSAKHPGYLHVSRDIPVTG